MKVATQLRDDPRDCYRRLKPRWWFLENFEQFKGDRLAQGYEVIVRHPGFLDWARGEHARINKPKMRPPIWSLEEVKDFSLAPPWTELSGKQKWYFVNAFLMDLKAIELFPFVNAHDRILTINCKDSSKSIVLALEALLKNGMLSGELANLLARQEPNPVEHNRIKGVSNVLLKFRPNNQDPPGFDNPYPEGFVDIDLSPLLEHYEKRTRRDLAWDSRNLLHTIKTFLDVNKDYSKYRKEVMSKHKGFLSEMRQSFPEWAAKELPGDRKRVPRPEELAIAFVAHDWKQVGKRRKHLDEASEKSLRRILKIATPPLWRNQLDALRKLHRKVNLPTPCPISLLKGSHMSEAELKAAGYRE